MRQQTGPAKLKGRMGYAAVAGMATCILCSTSDALAQQETISASSAAPRIRLGGSLGIGSGTYGLGATASFRVGVQITPFLAASYQATSASTSEFLGGNSDEWASHALLIEYMVPGKMFAIGGGPSYESGMLKHGCFSILTACDPPPTSESYTGIGFDGRIAYTFGANRPTARGGFTFELGLHASPHIFMSAFGIGFDIF